VIDNQTTGRRLAMAIPAIVIATVAGLHWSGAIGRTDARAAINHPPAIPSTPANRPAWQSDWPSDMPRRNLFLTRLDHFPRDVGTAQQPMRPEDPADEAKSADISTDHNHDESQSSLQVDANRIRLQSIMMHPVPRALVDGQMVGEGEFVGKFRVLRIELSRIVLEQQGYQFQITLK
jgi:hypothetical protein